MATLSVQQRQVVDAVVSGTRLPSATPLEIFTVFIGRNVFFTGAAGSGKSYVLREIVRVLRAKGRKLAVTAPTGVAAINIGGTTIHAWSGIGLGQESPEALNHRLSGPDSAPICDRWQNAETLLIDEISMIEAELLDKLEALGRRMRVNDSPFGGLQVVISGDFFQLPPVHSPASHKTTKFAFEARCWKLLVDQQFYLREVHRQKDIGFVQLLNALRIGQVHDEQLSALRSLSRPLQPIEGIPTTELYPTRWEVEKANESHLSSIEHQLYVFDSVDKSALSSSRSSSSSRRAFEAFKRMSALKVFKVKVGAAVMFLRNEDTQCLVNGSVGEVIGFEGEHEVPPQGLSEVRRSAGTAGSWPVVRFLGGETRTCSAEEFHAYAADGHVEVTRIQVPLILAWALSVHKAQGLTLDRVKVDLKRVFERGQAYVALSRAREQEGLEVQHVNQHRIQAHPTVLKWSLEQVWMEGEEVDHTTKGNMTAITRPARTT